MTTNKKIYLSLVIFFVASFCLIIFIVVFLFAGIEKNSNEIPIQKQKLVSLEAKIESLEKFKESYNEINPNLDKINNLFVDPEVPVDFMSFLEKTSRDCGISINTTLISAEKDDKDLWDFLSFQINSISSFSKFLIFLEKIENSPYLIEIESLNIRKLSEEDIKLKDFLGSSVGDVSTNLLIRVYTK